MKKKITVVSSCFNEVENLEEFCRRVKAAFEELPEYEFDMIIADNCSTDGSRELLRRLAAEDRRIKVILNAGNYGHIRSPYNALLQADGDAAVMLCSDLQEPPELIPELVRRWEEGYRVVCAVKPRSRENFLMFRVRCFYYWLLDLFSELP